MPIHAAFRVSTLPFQDKVPFLEHYGTRRNRWLANRLGLKGKGSERLANAVSSFFWNYTAAVTCDKLANSVYSYAYGCKLTYDFIVSLDNFDSLPFWVRADLKSAMRGLNEQGYGLRRLG